MAPKALSLGFSDADLSGSEFDSLERIRKPAFSLTNAFSISSISPRAFAAKQTIRGFFSTPKAKVANSIIALLGLPMIAFGSIVPADGLCNNIIALFSAWDGMLSISCLCVAAHTLAGAVYFMRRSVAIPVTRFVHDTPTFKDTILACCKSNSMGEVEPLSLRAYIGGVKTYSTSSRKRLFHSIATVVLLWFLILLGLVGPNSLVYPSWLWHPMLWGRYHVFSTKDVGPAISHICKDKNNLCLDDKEWATLSAGALYPTNHNDARGVRAGQIFASENSIVINVLARDIKHNIPALRVNVESLAPLFKEVALVIYENDSKDGTRDLFKEWGSETELGYTVDLMECEGVVDCKLENEYRDDAEDYSYASAIGKMHFYRNAAITYIQGDKKYESFSHLLVLDVDLSVPFSPLGILHTLGLKPNTVVASSGRQPWPTAFGSFTTPYDLTAFREYNTESTMGLEYWHTKFCGITEPAERWRNECHAISPVHLAAILYNDRKLVDGDFYRVDSAFNGAVLYPINLLRQSGAQYDNGNDNFGHRCEHVGLHYGLNKMKPMVVNKKWDMHLMPNYPGGSAWGRAKKTTDRIMLKPKLMLSILFAHVLTVGVFVWASFTFWVFGVLPLLSRIFYPSTPPIYGRGLKAKNSNVFDPPEEEPRRIVKLSV